MVYMKRQVRWARVPRGTHDAYKWRLVSRGRFMESIHKNNVIGTSLMTLFIYSICAHCESGWGPFSEPRAESQNPGGRTLGKAGCCWIKMIEYSAWVHMDVTQMRRIHKGKYHTAFQIVRMMFIFFLLVIRLGNYSCLSMNETIHYSLSKCLFNVAQ